MSIGAKFEHAAKNPRDKGFVLVLIFSRSLLFALAAAHDGHRSVVCS
jgi:hypothetical protein